MGDPTRKDNGQNDARLFVMFEMDLTTLTVTVETNVDDIPTLMRITGQGMHIWADNVMRQRVGAAQQQSQHAHAPSRRLFIPGRDKPS